MRRGEGVRAGGLAGAIGVEALDLVDDLAVVATAPHPVPFSAPLEDAFLPDADAIAATVKARLDGSSAEHRGALREP